MYARLTRESKVCLLALIMAVSAGICSPLSARADSQNLKPGTVKSSETSIPPEVLGSPVAGERADNARRQVEDGSGQPPPFEESPPVPSEANLEQPSKTFTLGVSQAHNLSVDNNATINRLKTSPNEIIATEAKRALDERNYDLARRLFEILYQRDPKNPDYFFFAGKACSGQGDPPDAFADFVTAWHLGDNPEYQRAANATVAQLKHQVDDTFKLTYSYKAHDPEVILNAAARCWKAGMTKQSVQLNEYALKNQPLLAHIAAYNLGAAAEHNGDYKLAREYYQWAAKRGHQLEAKANSDFRLRGEIDKSLNLLPTWYIEQAKFDTEQALQGHAVTWHGWVQTDSYPKHWCSEVCPLCAISRTHAEYKGGSSRFEP